MDDLISRQAAIDAINKALDRETVVSRWVREVAVDAVKALPPAQLKSCEDAVFWRKRAEEYENLCIKLIAEIGHNSKFSSVEINDKGIKFTMEKEKP